MCNFQTGDCQDLFHFPKDIFPKKQWKGLSNKFLAPGIVDGDYAGISFATAWVTSFLGMLCQAFPEESVEQRIQKLQQRAHWPMVELGYKA